MIKLLKNLTKNDYILAGVVLILTLVQIYFDLTLPDYMSEITLLIQTDGSEMSDIYTAGLKMILCALGSFSLAVVVAFIAAKIASNFSFITRSKMFKKVMDFSMKEINTFSISSLITRTTNDITQVQMLIVMGMQMLIKAPITAIWAIIKIYNKNITWTSATIVAILVLVVIVSICLTLAVPRFKKIQSLIDNINKVSKESLDGLNVVRAYNAEDYQTEKFEKANTEMTDTSLFTSRVLSFLMPSIQLISSSLVLSIYFIGAILINDAVGLDKMSLFADMVVFSAYAMQVIMSFMMLVMVFMLMPRASVSALRINEVFDKDLSITYSNNKDISSDKTGEIEFKNVNFRYPNAENDVLNNISFTAKQGEVIAFIGSTGCGKSSLINLIPRFYDATSGEVLVNGINVKDYTKNALSKKIGYVSQRATLFTGTIESNIIFGDNAILAEDSSNLENAIDISQAKEFVLNLSDKYKAKVAQGGRNFSGGQKQRLSIARAVFRKPEIFIFDDSFSALDYKTDRVLRETLMKKCSNSTMIIVGQRIGTIKDSDKIIVLDEGKIVGSGTHKQLLLECETYKQIALSQLSKEELENG